MCRNGNRGNHAACDGLAEASQDTRMNDSGESRKESTARKMEVLRGKNKTKNWILEREDDARDKKNWHKLQQRIKRYNLRSLGISESRWTASGRYRTNKGEVVLCSGRDDDQRYESF